MSHAVGCAFAICLEKKQKRDQDCSVTMNFDNTTTSFTRIGSFRQATITERLADPQVNISFRKPDQTYCETYFSSKVKVYALSFYRSKLFWSGPNYFGQVKIRIFFYNLDPTKMIWTQSKRIGLDKNGPVE